MPPPPAAEARSAAFPPPIPSAAPFPPHPWYSHFPSYTRSAALLSFCPTGLADLKVGEIVTGAVRKVETFGVFVTVDGCAASGLCHISEVADERIKSLEARVSVGERVKAIVLRVDPEVRRAAQEESTHLWKKFDSLPQPPQPCPSLLTLAADRLLCAVASSPRCGGRTRSCRSG